MIPKTKFSGQAYIYISTYAHVNIIQAKHCKNAVIAPSDGTSLVDFLTSSSSRTHTRACLIHHVVTGTQLDVHCHQMSLTSLTHLKQRHHQELPQSVS